jgi:hypothetical protein
VLRDKPFDQRRVVAGDAVRATEPASVARAQRGVITAAALADVVEESREIQHFLALEIGDEARAQRVLVRVLRLAEAPQVADHHERVLVHGVDVEEIVLHLAHDAPERGQVVAEHVVQIHPAKLVRQAPRLAEHLHEPRAIEGIGAKARVDAMPVAPQRAQRARRHALEFGVSLHRDERVEHGARAAHEQRLVGDVE